MTKLLVSGCSFTAHRPLEDNIEKRWCDFVADELNMELVNIAKSGAGNEYIFTSLYNALREDNEVKMVIAAWSKADRRDYKVKGHWTNDRVDLRGDYEYHLDKTQMYKDLLELVCKHHNVEYRSFQMIELYNRRHPEFSGNFYIGYEDTVQYHTIGHRNNGKDPNFISPFDNHPSQVGHKLIGQYIYENL